MSNFILNPSNSETVEFIFDKEMVETLARTTSHDFNSFVNEVCDNSIEANASRIEISFLEHSDYDFMIKDNGDGMTKDEVLNEFFRFGALTTEKTRGAHAHLGKVSILAALGEDGMMKMFTKKEGNNTVFIEWDGKSQPRIADDCKSYPEMTEKGTIIYITNCSAVDSASTITELSDIIATRYCHDLEKKSVVICFNGSELGPQDPLYWKYIDTVSGTWAYDKEKFEHGDNSKWEDWRYETHYTVLDKHNKAWLCRFRIRDLSQCADAIESEYHLNGRDRDRKALEGTSNLLTQPQNSGVYLNVDGYLITLGDSLFKPYINRKWHNIATGIRIEIAIPRGLAMQLNYSLNKSKGISSFGRYAMFGIMREKMLAVLEVFIQRRTKLQASNCSQKASQYTCKLMSKKEKKEISFSAQPMKNLSSSVFAKKNEDGGFTYNLSSTLSKSAMAKSDGMGKFKYVADTASLIYTAFINAYEKAKSKQPLLDADATLAQNVINARNYTLNTIKEYFENEFMSIGDEMN